MYTNLWFYEGTSLLVLRTKWVSALERFPQYYASSIMKCNHSVSSACPGLVPCRRAKLEKSLVERRVRLPQLDNLRWRVDVTISNR